MPTPSLHYLLTPLAADLGAFCNAVQASLSGLDYSERTPSADLLSLFALGALGQLQSEGLVSLADSRALATVLLIENFHWQEEEARIRAESLFEPSHTSHGLVHLILDRGAAAFDSWRSAPQFYTSFGVAELIESTQIPRPVALMAA
jgi:hypothetical protein